MKSLSAIETTHRDGQFGKCVALLLEEWARARTLDLAEAIDRVAARAPRVEPPTLRTNQAFQKHWLTLAAGNDPLHVTWLAETLTQRLDRHGELFNERLEAIRKHPDPRYAKAIVAMIEDGRPEVRWASEALVEVLATMGDERIKAALEARVALEAGDWAEVLPRLPAVRAPDAATTRKLRSLSSDHEAPKATSGSGDPKALLAAVQAAPDDLEARAVLADRLQELGDPFGELIALQLAELRGESTAETCKRVDELLGANLKAWLGPLFPLVYRGRFRGGFLEEMELEARWKTSEKGWAAIAEDPRLATVRTIKEGKTSGDVLARFYRSKTLRAIDKVAISSKEVALALHDNPPPRLRSVEAMGFKRGSYEKQLEELVVPWLDTITTVNRIGCMLEGVPVLQRSKAFGRLEELRVVSWDPLSAKEASALMEALPASLQVLDFVTNEPGDVLALLPKLPARVTTMHVGERARLHRRGKSWHLQIDVRHKVELDPARRVSGRLPAVLDLAKKKHLVSELEVLEYTDDYDRSVFLASKWKGVSVRHRRVYESGLTRPFKLG